MAFLCFPVDTSRSSKTDFSMQTLLCLLFFYLQSSITRYSGWQIAFTLWGKLTKLVCALLGVINYTDFFFFSVKIIIILAILITITQPVLASHCTVEKSVSQRDKENVPHLIFLLCFLFRLPHCSFCPLRICIAYYLCVCSSDNAWTCTEHVHPAGNHTVRPYMNYYIIFIYIYISQ